MVLSTYANNIYLLERLDYFCKLDFILSKQLPLTLMLLYCGRLCSCSLPPKQRHEHLPRHHLRHHLLRVPAHGRLEEEEERQEQDPPRTVIPPPLGLPNRPGLDDSHQQPEGAGVRLLPGHAELRQQLAEALLLGHHAERRRAEKESVPRRRLQLDCGRPPATAVLETGQGLPADRAQRERRHILPRANGTPA